MFCAVEMKFWVFNNEKINRNGGKMWRSRPFSFTLAFLCFQLRVSTLTIFSKTSPSETIQNLLSRTFSPSLVSPLQPVAVANLLFSLQSFWLCSLTTSSLSLWLSSPSWHVFVCYIWFTCFIYLFHKFQICWTCNTSRALGLHRPEYQTLHCLHG